MEPERPVGWPFGRRIREAAKARLGDLIASERKRAQFHIQLIRGSDPMISDDRLAQVISQRWEKVAAVEGGLTGAAGLFGIPLNLLFFTYSEVAVIVSIAEAYRHVLEGTYGEDTVLDVLGRAHGVEDVIRAGPRVLGSIAKTLALRYGFTGLGRLVPMISAPIAAKLNEREMRRVTEQAIRRFGGVVQIGP